MYKLVFFASLILSVGCASLGDKYAPSPVEKNKASLTIYRPSKFTGSAVSPYLCVNEQVVGEIANGGFLRLILEPGTHRIEQKASGKISGTFVTPLKAGQEYFIRYDASMYNGTSDNMKAGLNAGGIGGAIGGIAMAMFTPNKEEVDAITRHVDTRVQQTVHNPGMFFVTPEMAKQEILQTKAYKPVNFSKNHCASTKK